MMCKSSSDTTDSKGDNGRDKNKNKNKKNNNSNKKGSNTHWVTNSRAISAMRFCPRYNVMGTLPANFVYSKRGSSFTLATRAWWLCVRRQSEHSRWQPIFHGDYRQGLIRRRVQDMEGHQRSTQKDRLNDEYKVLNRIQVTKFEKLQSGCTSLFYVVRGQKIES